jgi:parallel beta-helix repeat protein
VNPNANRTTWKPALLMLASLLAISGCGSAPSPRADETRPPARPTAAAPQHATGSSETQPPAPVAGTANDTAPVQKGHCFYVDPVKGTPQGDGSAANPWRTLAEVFRANLIQTKNASGQVQHANAPVRAGDSLLLRSGYHGEITLSGAYNDEFITVAAEKGHTPKLGRLDIHDAARWIFRGLTISPSFMDKPYTGTMAQLAEGGPGSELVLEDCFLYTTLDVANWSAKDWMEKPAQGIQLGRHGTNLTARNNHVLNVRFGINLCSPDSLCEGNIVENFSGDGMRVTRDGITVQYNVIKNVYVSAEDGDDNHDDGIQCFLFNKGTGTVRKATIRGNLIINREDPKQPFQNTLQAIGFFDGPLVDFLVEDNVINTSHWHGVSLYDAQNCTIRNNVVWTEWQDVKLRPWVMLGTKKNQAEGNRVENNLAFSFNFKADKKAITENNKTVTKEAYELRRHELEVLLATKFGRLHPTSNRKRVDAQPTGTVASPAAPATQATSTAPAGAQAVTTAQTTPPAKPAAVSCPPETLKEWQTRLRERTRAVIGEKKRVRFELTSLKSRITVQAMDEQGAMKVAMEQGGQMDVTWAQLEPRDHFNLALALAATDEPEDHALAAFYLLLAQQKERGEEHLSKAGDLASAVQKAFGTAK